MVMIIMTTVVTSLTALFVSGAKAAIELNDRFRLAAARPASPPTRSAARCTARAASRSRAPSNITVVLPGHCPTATGGAVTNVVYTTQLVSTGRYRLKRGTAIVADYLTSGNVFAYVAPTDTSLGKL